MLQIERRVNVRFIIKESRHLLSHKQADNIRENLKKDFPGASVDVCASMGVGETITPTLILISMDDNDFHGKFTNAWVKRQVQKIMDKHIV